MSLAQLCTISTSWNNHISLTQRTCFLSRPNRARHLNHVCAQRCKTSSLTIVEDMCSRERPRTGSALGSPRPGYIGGTHDAFTSGPAGSQHANSWAKVRHPTYENEELRAKVRHPTGDRETRSTQNGPGRVFYPEAFSGTHFESGVFQLSIIVTIAGEDVGFECPDC